MVGLEKETKSNSLRKTDQESWRNSYWDTKEAGNYMEWSCEGALVSPTSQKHRYNGWHTHTLRSHRFRFPNGTRFILQDWPGCSPNQKEVTLTKHLSIYLPRVPKQQVLFFFFYFVQILLLKFYLPTLLILVAQFVHMRKYQGNFKFDMISIQSMFLSAFHWFLDDV